MSISECFRNWILHPVLEELKKMEVKMANNQADLDAALTTLGTGVSALADLVQKLADEVTALIEKVGTGVDLTNEVQAIQSMASTISDDATKLQGAIDAAKGVTGS